MPKSVDVIIGLDFGTRFSKVCYRVLDGSRPAVVVLDVNGQKASIIESTLWIDPLKHFVTTVPGGRRERALPLCFLKMLLMRSAEALDQPVLELGFMKPPGKRVPALSAFLVSQLIRRSMLSILSSDAARLDGKKIRWSLNLSIPAQHADDGLRPVFRDVGAVGLKWAVDALGGERGGLITPTVEKICEKYEQDRSLAAESQDVSVIPEIVAALHHFIRRAQTPEGVHGFVDIGAGTVDACIFRISHHDEEPTVPVLSAKVGNLGSASISAGVAPGLGADDRHEIESVLVSKSMPSPDIAKFFSKQELLIENFTAQLAMAARDNMIGRALVHDPVSFIQGDHGQLDRSFRFYSTGGGAGSAWYRGAMEGVYRKRTLRGSNMMRWSIGAAPPPTEFPSNVYDFSRFIIAWGLTAEGVALEELRLFLPSQLDVRHKDGETMRHAPVYEGR